MRKVIGPVDECWICGRNGAADPLDRHHVYGGSNRGQCEQDGLCVMLCHHDCHIFGEMAVHKNGYINRALKESVQRAAMEIYDWTVDDFRARYGKSYL